MKKLPVIFLCLLISYNVSAQDEGFMWGIFPAGIGASFYKGETYMDFDLNFFYLSAEHKTGMGITWIPVNYKRMQNKNYWSFVNFQTHYNVLAFTSSKNSFLGPYAAVNYAQSCKFDNNYIFSYGIKYYYSEEFFLGRMYGVNLECGFRKTNDIKNSFYFNAGMDLMWFIPVAVAVLTYPFRLNK